MSSESLKGFQKKYLRGLAHKLNPVVHIGRKGVSETLMKSLEEALDSHELVKVKFVDLKEKDKKKEIISKLESKTGCELIGTRGHTAIFFRRNTDPEKHKINIPKK
jgi:RNA-binding protein